MHLTLTVRSKILQTCVGASVTSRRVTILELIQKGDLVNNSHSTWARRRNHFSQLLNEHGVNHVRQAELHTAKPLVPQPSASEVEMAIEKLERHKLPGNDPIPAESIKAGGRTIRSEIHELIYSI